MFQEASFDETHMALGQREHNPRAAEQDAKLIVLFTEEPWHDRAESAKEGRPIYKLRDFVMIMVPGDKDSIVHRLASQIDIDRFPTQYQRYKNKQEQRFGSGTPLKAVTFLSAAQTKELEFFNVYTVEQLAAIPDVHAQKFMGIHALKKMAADFLEAARGQAPITHLNEELRQRDEKIAGMEQAMEEMKKELQSLKATHAEA